MYVFHYTEVAQSQQASITHHVVVQADKQPGKCVMLCNYVVKIVHTH